MKVVLISFAYLLLLCSIHASEPVYFVVGPMKGHPSESSTNTFLLPLNRAEDIRKARKLAALRGTGWVINAFATPEMGDQMPVFKIGVGPDGVNRDVTKTDEPLWNWHVKEFVYWGDAFIVDRYPTPQAVEAAVNAGTLRENDRIFLGAYRIHAELSPEMILYVERKEPIRGPLVVYWTHSNYGDQYQVEWTPDLHTANWQVLEGHGSGFYRYPIVYVLEVSLSLAAKGFFRLRAGP